MCLDCLPIIMQADRDGVLNELMELVREDLKQDFDEELYITHGDLLWCISEVRQSKMVNHD